MRLLLSLLVLLALFGGAVLWQKRWTAQARAERDARISRARGEDSGLPAGWSRVIVGRPAGTHAQDPAAGTVATDSTPRPAPSPTSTPLPAAGAFERVALEAGQTLSALCQERYGTARREVVLALARFNRLADPDAVREGQVLELPPLQELLAPR